MFFKHYLDWTDVGVWLFGRLHGSAFVFYFFVSVYSAIRLRWGWWYGSLAILGRDSTPSDLSTGALVHEKRFAALADGHGQRMNSLFCRFT